MKLKDLYRSLSPKFQNIHLEYKVDFKPRYGHGTPPHEQLNTIIEANKPLYSNIIEEALKNAHRFHEIKHQKDETDANKPVYNNGYFPGLDIVALYSIISKYKPAKYIEVGSGNSTKVAFQAICDNQLKTEIVSIDPFPRSEIDQLANTVIRKPFEQIDFNFIFDLKPNDILFIDNSHRILPNSDAMVFFMEVLPKVPKGVIVHIHDIYLPYDYPQFMCDRSYSEQYGLAMYLLANSKKYSTLFPCYFVSEDTELKETLNPIWNHKNLDGVERHGGSYWLRIEE